MLGLLNTVYTVGGIITGWFFAGPLVGIAPCLISYVQAQVADAITRPTGLAEDGEWESVASLRLLQLSCSALLPAMEWGPLWLVESLSEPVRLSLSV